MRTFPDFAHCMTATSDCEGEAAKPTQMLSVIHIKISFSFTRMSSCVIMMTLAKERRKEVRKGGREGGRKGRRKDGREEKRRKEGREKGREGKERNLSDLRFLRVSKKRWH